MNRSIVALVIGLTSGGLALAQPAPSEKPYTPEQTAEMNSDYIQSLKDQGRAVADALLQTQAMLHVEHRLRLEAEKARDDAKAELAKLKPQTPAKPEN